MSVTQDELDQFTGTTQYYIRPIFPHFRYTDGIQFLAEEGKCHWLIDFVFSHQLDPAVKEYSQRENFQVWRLKVNDDSTAVITCEDGNDNIIMQREIVYTDFPLQKLTLFFQDGVLFLPSEY